ncbi:MAG TPA: PQQ-dependent sugar dehydrogenase [Chloroflexia bacterium]|nr:PQQ-dependent sugar dehydrogenase [Chloroflexia bacterium]
MKTKVTLLLLATLLAALALLAGAAVPVAGQTPRALPYQPSTTEPLPDGATVQTVTGGLGPAVAMAFDPAGRLFVTEKTGAVRLIVGGVLQPSPVMTFDVDTCSERGLLGIALDPAFTGNHYVYVYYTAASGCGPTTNRVVRFTEKDGVGSDVAGIFSSPQTAGNHNGGNIHFGPDGKLYVSVGDNANAANAQDVTAKNGKMHRLNPDGSAPADNPRFSQAGALPSLFAIGLRNSFDFTFDPVTSGIFASENGPGCDDEMNRIVGGYNYGWRPSYPCDDGDPNLSVNTIPALWYVPQSLCCIAPTGIEVYGGASVPEWQNDLFQCNYSRTGALIHFRLSADRTVAVSAATVSRVTCTMDITTGPDGALYYFEGGGYSPATLKRIAGAGLPPAPPTAPPVVTPAPGADPLFNTVWERVDRPVKEGVAQRSWTWGPAPRAVHQEPFDAGTRLVQYWDKARFELNPAAGGKPAYVTNGLLVVEMMSGRIQIGRDEYDPHGPAGLPVGGDSANNPAPTYEMLARVASLAANNQAQPAVGAVVTASMDANGTVAPVTPPVSEPLAVYEPATGHNIPRPFWTFLTASGPVYENGRLTTGRVLDWVATVGYPITEPYWTRMAIGGQVHDVMVQAFQRQTLTFIPDYQAPWRVQFGNVGVQYYQWRYGRLP